MKTRGSITLALIALSTLGICSAQTPETSAKDPNERFFHLSFIVKEVEESKLINSRSYSAIASTWTKGIGESTVRTGSKVPVQAGSADLTYIDLGVGLDYRVLGEAGSSLIMLVKADISSIATAGPESFSAQMRPVIRQNKWNSVVIVPLAKPTTVFSSDDLTSKREMQIELTATPIVP